MAIVFIDGFDHYGATSHISRKWNTVSGSGISLITGRFGTGNALKTGTNSSTLALGLTSGATFYVGVAYQNISGDPATILSFKDGTTVQCGLAITSGGFLYAYRSSTATVLGYASTSIKMMQWNYIEIKVTISDAAGAFEVRLNGNTSPIINLSSVDTKATANASANSFELAQGSNVDVAYDDIYVSDSAFLGDVRVQTLLPNANGTYSQLTRTGGGSNNYEAVDDTTPDDDITYVSETSGAAKKDAYNYPATSGTIATVHTVQTNILARKTDAGAVQIRPFIKSGVTESTGTSVTPSTSFTYLLERFVNDPNTGSAWTQANLNAAEFGVEVI